MALDADFKWHVEENGVDFVVVVLGEFDPVLALLRGEVGGVNVIRGTLGDEPRLQHGAQIGEDEVLKALLTDVIEEQRTNHVARERNHAVALEPGTLAGTGQADGENNNAFRRALRHGGGRGRSGRLQRWRRSSGCGLGGLQRVVRFRQNRGCDSFGSEGLRDGLFAATASASAASTTTSAATGASCRFAGRGRVDGVRDQVWNIVWNIGGSSVAGIRGRGVSGRSFHVRSGSRTNGTTTGAGPRFRLRLRVVGGRCPAAFVFCIGCGRLLLGVEICGLQRRRSRLVRRLGRLFLAALKTIAHPFTHVRLVTHMPRREQWFTVVSRNRKPRRRTEFRVELGRYRLPPRWSDPEIQLRG